MSDRMPRLAEIGLPPVFDAPESRPELPAARYAERIEQLRARMAARHYDRLVVWADREHSAGLSFLTGFDPRFEEAILVMADVLGIRLHPDVLPFSNLPAYLPPFLLRPDRAMTMVEAS